MLWYLTDEYHLVFKKYSTKGIVLSGNYTSAKGDCHEKLYCKRNSGNRRLVQSGCRSEAR